MNRRDNFLKAVNFEEPEWVPIDCSTHCGIMKQKFEELAEYFGIDNPEYRENLSGMCSTMDERVWGRLPIDTRTVLLNPPDNYRIFDISKDVFQVSDFGYVMKKVPLYNEFHDPMAPLRNATQDSLDSFQWWPDPYGPGRVRGLREWVLQLYKETDFVLKLETPVNGLMEIAQWLRGREQWYLDLSLNEEFVNKLLNKIMRIQKDFYTIALGEIGDLIQVVEMSDDFGMQTGPQISLEMYRKYFKPLHAEVWRHIHNLTDAKLYLHSCGAISEFIPEWIEMGLDIIESLQPRAEGMDPRELKRKYGGKIVLWGGMDVQYILPFGTPEEVESEVKRLIGIYAPGGGYVFSTAHVIQPDQPLLNILTMFNATKKYGKYPVSG